MPDRRTSADHRLDDEARRRILAEAIDALPIEARELVTIYYWDDRSTGQIALLLDLSEETVKKRLQRARAALYEAVLDRGVETSVN